MLNLTNLLYSNFPINLVTKLQQILDFSVFFIREDGNINVKKGENASKM